MSVPVTRRRALAASAAAALGLGAGVAPALAVPTVETSLKVTVSAEAKALQDELARLSFEHRTASREMDRADEATVEVDPPEEIFARPGDVGRLHFRYPTESWAAPGRRWYGDVETIDRLREDSFLTLAGTPSDGATRRDEIVSAWDRWRADVVAAEVASGFTAAEARYRAARDAYSDFRTRLVDLRTEDPEVLVVKALAIADLCRGTQRLENSIASSIGEWGGAYEGALSLSLARDFLGLIGKGVLS